LSATEAAVGHGDDGRSDENGQSGDGEINIPPSDDDRSWAEGDKKKVAHLRRERASGLAMRKKSDFIERNGKLACERCGLIPSEILGSNGDAVIEVHHKRPLAEAEFDTRTRLDDLSCLCANCHRITHREMSAGRT
jgi:5-methylcytosine-specific restriction protein A